MSESRTTYGGEAAEATARDQIIAEALAPAYRAISSDTSHVKPAVEWLIAEAQRSLEPSTLAEVGPVIQQLLDITNRIDAGENDNTIPELTEGAYLIRGLIANPETALALLHTRR